MTQPHFAADDLRALADVACDSALSEDDVARLERLLSGNVEAQQFYLAQVCLDTWLRSQFARSTEEPSPPRPSPTINILADVSPGTVSYFSSGWPVAYLVATAILGIGLWIGSLMPVSWPQQIAEQAAPPGRSNAELKEGPVGQITGMVDCRFDSPSYLSDAKTHDPRPKTLISLGDKFVLASGLMEITYDVGAKVILQGPVAYTVESAAGGYLSVGKLTAMVETAKPQAANHQSEIRSQKLFAIRTPTATVTDLGTEFGVEVGSDGNTTSHVFRGSVELQPVGGDSAAVALRVLHEDQSARVEKLPADRNGLSRVAMIGLAGGPVSFVREMPKPTVKTFDLVDVVAGGDGFSGRRNHGIDVTNGRPSDTQPPSPCFALRGDGKYHRAEGLPLVDGVFVPDGRTGRVQIDSTGHVVDVFPESPPETAFNVWAGGPIPTNAHFKAVHVSFPTELDGIDYASSGHGLLLMYPNKGITFDLEAIRRGNAGCTLLRFRAVAANMVTVHSTANAEAYWCADIWVFVDGQVRFQRRRINRSNGMYSILIPLGKNDRFLTLAATDGGDGNDWDLVMFGDPRLELLVKADFMRKIAGH